MTICWHERSGYTFDLMPETNAPVQSPCLGNCCLDDEFVCTGCFRSLEEIKEWGVVDDQRRRVIVQNAVQRKAAGSGGA
jgi:uncharacterized protein